MEETAQSALKKKLVKISDHCFINPDEVMAIRAVNTRETILIFSNGSQLTLGLHPKEIFDALAKAEESDGTN